ncbi:MAG TPA: DUF4349 domain-containing protein [Polyangiaceae bacterium]|nr:DUF4349 domain-containing protein [Polyangiaceae bacterium]
MQLLAERGPIQRSRPEGLLDGPLSAAPAARKSSSPWRHAQRAVFRALDAPAPPPAAPSTTPTSGPGERRELIDLEARLALEVSEPRLAAQKVRALTVAACGEIVSETFEDNASANGSALSLRVPSDKAQSLIAQVSALGKLISLKTQSTEMSRRFGDADTVLQNLEAALTHYQDLLDRAQNAHEMTEIEKELERVRLSIDRVNTDLEWMKDRVARSTVYVQLALPRDERAEKTAQLYPGLRLPYLIDLEPGGGKSGYFGGGFSALVARPFNLDLDLLTHTDASRRDGVDLLLASVGVELYSNLLGAGKRRYLNPYLGFRAGYANLSSDDALLLGGSLGVELLKTSLLLCEVQARAYAFVGGERGTHALLQPALALNFAY